MQELITSYGFIFPTFLDRLCLEQNKASRPQQFQLHLYTIWSLMSLPPDTQKNMFFKQILLRKPAKKRSSIPLSTTLIDEDYTVKVNKAKQLLESKMQQKAQFKRLFETLTKPINKNPFIYAQYRKRNNINSSKDGQKNDLEGKMNQLIYNAEIQKYIKKADLREKESKPIKNIASSVSKYSLCDLRRSFRISEHCKSQLLELNQKNRVRKLGSLCTSISHSCDRLQSKVLKRKVRYNLKPKFNSIEGLSRKDQQLSGWQESPMRYLTNYDVQQTLY